MLANPTRYQKVMLKLIPLTCLLTLLVCEPCLADSVPASPAEGRSVARMGRGIPKQVFACDGVTATSCEDGVCQILCDDSTVVRCYSYVWLCIDHILYRLHWSVLRMGSESGLSGDRRLPTASEDLRDQEEVTDKKT